MLASRPRRAGAGAAPFAVESTSAYGGRACSGAPLPPTPGQATDAINADLIAQKRRTQLMQQIRDKEEMLAQYRRQGDDTRGLEIQLQQLRGQLDKLPGAHGQQPARSSVVPTPVQQPFSATPSIPATPASHFSNFSTGSGPGGARTRRDDVWERKYHAFLARKNTPSALSAPGIAGDRRGYGSPEPFAQKTAPEMGARRMSSGRMSSNPRLLPEAPAPLQYTPVSASAPQSFSATPPHAPVQQNGTFGQTPQYAAAPSFQNGHPGATPQYAPQHSTQENRGSTFGFGATPPAAHAPSAQQNGGPILGGAPQYAPAPSQQTAAVPSGEQEQSGARYGRRATPPASTHSQQSSFLNFGSEPRNGYGRKRQNF